MFLKSSFYNYVICSWYVIDILLYRGKKDCDYSIIQQGYVNYSVTMILNQGLLIKSSHVSDVSFLRHVSVMSHFLLLSPDLYFLDHLGVLSISLYIPEFLPSQGLWTWDFSCLGWSCSLHHWSLSLIIQY